MISDEVGSPAYIPHYLWKLLIDERYQRRGFGTATLDLIVEYFRGRPGVEALSTSAGQGDGSPIAFYERYGFEQPATSCSTTRSSCGSTWRSRAHGDAAAPRRTGGKAPANGLIPVCGIGPRRATA